MIDDTLIDTTLRSDRHHFAAARGWVIDPRPGLILRDEKAKDERRSANPRLIRGAGALH